MLCQNGTMMNNRFEYSYPIDQCDIVDKKKGEIFRQKRLQWMKWLNGDDPHSICRQVYSMLWDYALFCSVNEMRRIADTEPKSGVGFNGAVIRLFDAGFVTTQASTIRRLIEKPKADLKWAVISVRRILKDIKDNIGCITRENYVSHDGLPYDYGTVHQRWFASLPITENGVCGGSLAAQGPDAWVTAERVHQHFDILAQAKQTERTREDLVKVEILEHLEAQIEKCDHIKTYVDKFIAHAAAPETRTGLQDDEKAITLERLEACHKIIYQVTSFISGPLLWESGLGGLPVPQYDHLKNIEKRWVNPKNMGKVREKWDAFEKEVAVWDSVSLWPLGFVVDQPEA